jgi:hypothetical protein
MKNLFKLFAITALTLAVVSSCKKDPTPDPDPTPTENIIEGDITTAVVLDATKKYKLRGKVYVQAGASITIPAGTIIVGEKSTDGTLIINRGGQIFSNGTPDKPVIMTSEAPKGFRNRGDWGGVVICGNSTSNGNPNSTIEGISGEAGSENGVYGPGASLQVNQNSGTMTYTRIEFAGIDLSQDNELNSLTMGSVGSGTTIHHIVVSYANDDAYEWFGGTNNMSYLIAYNTLDDDFDSDRGFSGNIQYGLIVREKATADISTSRAFESSSNNSASASPHTSAKFANVTIMGPRLFGSSINTLYGAALEINSNSSIEVHNSIVTGFPIGLRLNTAGTDAKVVNCVFANNTTLFTLSGGSTIDTAAFNAANVTDATAEQIWGTTTFDFNPLGPIFQASTSPYLTGAPNLSAAGFEAQPFYGAFGAAPHAGWNWNSGWIELDPINADY